MTALELLHTERADTLKQVKIVSSNNYLNWYHWERSLPSNYFFSFG